MTALREKMIEDMQLRGLLPNTQQAYMRAVQKLAEYFNKSPDKITEGELREYLLHLKNVKKVAPSSFTSVLAGIKLFYIYTLQRQWPKVT